MTGFLRSIPAAASGPYALAAYAIAALVFLVAGARLRMAKLLLAKINSIPEAERRRALEIATGTILPAKISPEQWMRNNRLRWTFLLLASLLIVALAIVSIAVLNPTQSDLDRATRGTRESAQETQRVVQQGTIATARRINTSTQEIIATFRETTSKIAERVESDNSSKLQRRRAEERLQSEKDAITGNNQVDSDLNSLAAAFENLFKGRVETIDAERDRPQIAQIYSLKNNFDRDAWSWFPRLIQELEVAHLLGPTEVSQAKNLAACYDRTLVKEVKPMDAYWFLLESKPTYSPPEQLSRLIRDTRDKLHAGSRERSSIVAAMTELLKDAGKGRSLNFQCPVAQPPS